MLRLLKRSGMKVAGAFFSDAPRIRQAHVNGRPLLLWENEHIGRKILLGVFEKSETAWVRSTVKRGDICLDIGTNIGYFTQLLSQLVGSSGLVLAVEPFLRNAKAIELTTLINHCEDRVRVVNCAVGDQAGHVEMLSGNDSAYARISVTSDSASVPLRTLDEIVSSEDLSRIDFLKMDIEGAELNALKGFERILSDPDAGPAT